MILAPPTPLAKALRDARKSFGWTQLELAERAGIAERSARSLERGKGNVETFEKALGALKVVLCYRHASGTVPEVISTLRKRRGLTQRGLAELAKVSQPTIGNLEHSRTGQLASLERVLTTLEVDPIV